ncbi:MAG: hypothetical protein AAGG01_02195 [Planctomycetota bacterium]
MKQPLLPPAMRAVLPSLALLVTLFASAACRPSHRVPSRLDPGLLRAIPRAETAPISEALRKSADARSAYRSARKETAAAGDAAQLAVTELNVVKRAIDERRTELGESKDRESAARSAAQASYDEAIGIARIARRGLALARREHEQCALRERLALEESRLADAEVELARGIAALNVKRRGFPPVPIEDLREAVAFHSREIEIARRRLDDARVRMLDARAAYESAIALEGK